VLFLASGRCFRRGGETLRPEQAQHRLSRSAMPGCAEGQGGTLESFLPYPERRGQADWSVFLVIRWHLAGSCTHRREPAARPEGRGQAWSR